MLTARKIIGLLLLTATTAFSQNWQLKKADRYYYQMQYAVAAEWYARLAPANQHALSRLADCYFRLNASEQAEQNYAKLISAGKAAPEEVLHYAQVLHQNAKYSEAQAQYEAHRKLISADRRSAKNSQGLASVSDFFVDSANVRLTRLGLNTENEEFGPALYNGGLVYVSDKPKPQITKHLFGWNNRPFLDAYFVPMGELKMEQERNPRFRSEHSESPVRLELSPERTNLFRDLNSIYHEGPMVFFASGDSVIFTRNNYHNKRYKTDKSGVNRLKLFIARKAGGLWTNIEPLPINNDEYSVGHPALSPDEKTLYFSSDRPGGLGETDIWRVSIANGKFGEPENMGPAVNTEGREMFPYVDVDGNLFFSSDGHGGLGGLDNFYSEWADSGFAEPANVGAPINSNRDDFNLILDQTNTHGFFATFRDGEKSRDDIYSFQSQRPLVRKYFLNGIVLDVNTRQPLENAMVSFQDSKGNKLKTISGKNGSFTFRVSPRETYTIGSEKEKYKPGTTMGVQANQPLQAEVLMEELGAYGLLCLITDNKTGAALDSVKVVITDTKSGSTVMDGITPEDGQIKQAMEKIKKSDVGNYSIALNRRGFLSKIASFSVTYDMPGDVPVHQTIDLSLSAIEKGTDIGKLLKVNPIYFDLGKSIIRPDASKELDKIVKVMQENPGMTIELGSHTDSRGSDASNLALSDKRARASAAYIVSKGIVANRIVGKGYGESKLVNRCGNGVACSEAEHQLNRRTEFIVTSLGNQ